MANKSLRQQYFKIRDYGYCNSFRTPIFINGILYEHGIKLLVSQYLTTENRVPRENFYISIEDIKILLKIAREKRDKYGRHRYNIEQIDELLEQLNFEDKDTKILYTIEDFEQYTKKLEEQKRQERQRILKLRWQSYIRYLWDSTEKEFFNISQDNYNNIEEEDIEY